MKPQDDIRASESEKISFVGDKEHILDTRDKAEIDHMKANVECRRTLQGLGYIDFTFEDFLHHDELLERSRNPFVSDYVVMFFRFVTTGESTKFFEAFIMGLANSSVERFSKSSVEPMGEESDHVHIPSLSDALGQFMWCIWTAAHLITAS
ncbi:hypothetical protein SAY87_013060 [Trapa incisa]|uniref:Uncharacterized protein n=1 Tax=Trapa incisa TaxID=236973 RepID=A0AAN7QCM2_9MYRT|nr:hypothetical protein SAY87_013060 [Trapa incisa]